MKYFRFCSVLALLLSPLAAAGSSDFLDADLFKFETQVTYFVKLEVDGQQASLEVDQAEYRLLADLKKLSLGGGLRRSTDELTKMVESINKKSMAVFGKGIIVNSEEGYSLYRKFTEQPKGLFHLSIHGVYYRGQEIELTKKQSLIVKALAESPDHILPYEDIAKAAGWNGRNYRTNVRDYTQEINNRVFSQTGTELLTVEGRGKALRLRPTEPSIYTAKEMSRVHGRIIDLEGNALAIAEAIQSDIRENLPRELEIPTALFLALNLNMNDFLQGIAEIYKVAGVKTGGLTVRIYYGGAYSQYTFDEHGRASKSSRRSRYSCAGFLL